MKSILESQVAVIEAAVGKMSMQDQDAYFRLKRELAMIAAAHPAVGQRVLVALGLAAIVDQMK